MPVISMFYGVVILMYYFDNKQHKMPHIHAQYGDEEAVVSIPEGNILEGTLPSAKLKLVLAWIEIHKEELLANWRLATEGQQVFKIDPLK
jgi:predicted esterase